MNNTVKILHTADIHIGAAESFLGENASLRRFETLTTFEKIIDLGKERSVDIIILAGDVFDSNRVEERFINAFFEKIEKAAPIKAVFAAGNHDPLNSDSPFLNRTLPENLFVLGTKDECITFEELNLKVYGRSFESSSLKGEETFSISPISQDYVNLMVQHGDLCNDLNSEYNPITPKFVKSSGMDYIALGHVHKRIPVAKLGNTHFAYCGCPEGQGFDELDEKGVYIGEIGKNICNLEFVTVSQRRHIHEKIDISEFSNSGEISAHIIDTLKKIYGESFGDNLYKIELTGQIKPDAEIITDEIKSRLATELYFVKLKDNTEYYVNLEELSEEVSLKGIFVKKMLEKEQNAVDTEKPLIRKALMLGLKAFSGEVKYNED